MTRRPRISVVSRLLALLLGAFFALQPAVRAAGCESRSMLSRIAGRSCCCAAMRSGGADTRSCCAGRQSEPPPIGPRLLGDSCDCEMRAPSPQDALPRTTDPRSASAEGERAAADWIAEGARASATTAWFPGIPTPGSSSDPSPPIGCRASCERRLSGPDAVARSCERGVNGLLAVLGVVRL